MDGQNNFKSSQHGLPDRNTESRLSDCERYCVLFQEQIKTLKHQHEEVDAELNHIRQSQLDVVKTINDRINQVEKTINERISQVQTNMVDRFKGLEIRFDALVLKFDNFSSANKTMLIAILVAVLTSMVIGGLTFIFNR